MKLCILDRCHCIPHFTTPYTCSMALQSNGTVPFRHPATGQTYSVACLRDLDGGAVQARLLPPRRGPLGELHQPARQQTGALHPLRHPLLGFCQTGGTHHRSCLVGGTGVTPPPPELCSLPFVYANLFSLRHLINQSDQIKKN